MVGIVVLPVNALFAWGIGERLTPGLFGNLGYLLVTMGVIMVTILRREVRAAWTSAPDTYQEYHWSIVVCGVFLFLVGFLVYNNSASNCTRLKQKLGYAPVIFSFALSMGLVLELITNLLSALLYRLMLPITATVYSIFLYLGLAGLFLLIVGLCFFTYKASQDGNVLYVFAVVHGIHTLHNTFGQLVMREASYTIPAFIVALLSIGSILIVGGLILLHLRDYTQSIKYAHSNRKGEAYRLLPSSVQV